MTITGSRITDLLHWHDDMAADHTVLFDAMTAHRDSAALIRQLQAEVQEAWQAGLDEGRAQGRRNRLAEAATHKRELDSAGAFHFSDNGAAIDDRITQRLTAASWSDMQCVEFIRVAMRHTEYKRGNCGPTIDDIRLGQKRANALSQQGARTDV